jgi:hypothetical protein
LLLALGLFLITFGVLAFATKPTVAAVKEEV